MHLIPAFIRSPGPEFISLGFYDIRWYGLLISFSLLIGVFISKKLAKSRCFDPNFINELLPGLVLFSIIGARAYYVIFEYRQFSGFNFFTTVNVLNHTIKFPSFLAIWEGGIAIHGALIGGLLSLLLFCRAKKIPFVSLLDTILPSVILGQSIGRWGNFFNNEAFGLPTDLPWKLFIPMEYRPIEFLDKDFFHPTFLYESIWNFLIFILLIFVFNQQNRDNRFNQGIVSCLYLITYSFGRFWIEGLRLDSLCLGALPPYCEGGIRIAQFMSIILFSSGLIWIFFINSKLSKHN